MCLDLDVDSPPFSKISNIIIQEQIVDLPHSHLQEYYCFKIWE